MAPLVIAVIGHEEESRGFWIEFGVGLGFVGLAMMGLQFVLTARYNRIGAPFGIGTTPIMSILHTLKERNDERTSTLIFGNASKKLTPFYDELKMLEAESNLKVMHVFEDPDDDWDGDTGYITPEMIRKHLPEEITNCDYFICGTAPMMDVAEGALRDWECQCTKFTPNALKISDNHAAYLY